MAPERSSRVRGEPRVVVDPPVTATARTGEILGEGVPALAHPSDAPGGIARHQRMGGYVPGHYSSRRHKGVLSDGVATNHGDVRAQGSALSNPGGDEFRRRQRTNGSGSQVVGKCRVGTHENVVLEYDSIPDLDTVFDHHPIPNDRPLLDEALPAEIAVPPDNRPIHHVGQGPDPGSGSHRIAFTEGLRMDEYPTGSLFEGQITLP